jgi:hypothetical protein
MSDISRLHRDAIRALLAPLESPPTSYQIFTAKVVGSDSDLEYPYLTVWSTPADRTPVNLPGNVSAVATVTQVSATGRDEDEVLAALDRVAELLEGKPVTITGRNPGRPRQVSANPYVIPSDDVHTTDGQATYQGVIQYRLNSTASAA